MFQESALCWGRCRAGLVRAGSFQHKAGQVHCPVTPYLRSAASDDAWLPPAPARGGAAAGADVVAAAAGVGAAVAGAAGVGPVVGRGGRGRPFSAALTRETCSSSCSCLGSCSLQRQGAQVAMFLLVLGAFQHSCLLTW